GTFRLDLVEIDGTAAVEHPEMDELFRLARDFEQERAEEKGKVVSRSEAPHHPPERLAEDVVAVLSVADHVFAVRETTEQPVDRPLVDPRTCRDLPEREPLGPRGRNRL